MRRKTWQVIIPTLLLCFLSWNLIFASSFAAEIKIPNQFGSIKEAFEAPSQSSLSQREIIHIQDAHCNYEAQKNMAGLLDYLVKQYNLKLIMVEGGSGDVSLSFLRGYADAKARTEVAEKYLKEGKISGEEYLDIISTSPLELYGVEDKVLYDAHLAAFEKVDSFRKGGLKELDSLNNIITALKPFIYSDELKQLEAKKKGYEEKTVSLADYCGFLNDAAKKKNIDAASYSSLAAFSELGRLEKKIDFKTAESQRDAFIKDLSKVSDETGMRSLLLMTQGFKAKMIPAEQYYSFLKTAGEQKFNLKRKYPQFNAYLDYMNLSKETRADDILAQISVVETKIEEVSFAGADDKRLSEISRANRILTKALNIEMAPEDYAYFKVNKDKFITASWIDFLAQNCAKYNITQQPAASKIVDTNIEQLDNFYKLGADREKAFIRNLTAKLKASDVKVAALIAGGFHTPGITRLLKEEGYSYTVVTPVITEKADAETYFSVLKSKNKGTQEEAAYTSDEE